MQFLTPEMRAINMSVKITKRTIVLFPYNSC
jgi:hypothetical protein